MLQFFRSNQFFAGFLLIFYAAILRLPAWFTPAGELNGRDLGAGLLGQFYIQLGTDSRTLNILLPMVVLFLTALLVNQVVIKHRMSEQPTQLPGLFVILVGSASPAILGLHSIQPANFFLFLSLAAVYNMYQKGQKTLLAFDAGIWLGVAVLFNAYFVVYLLLLFMAVVSLNSLRLKFLLQLICGTMLPAFLLGSWYFWMGKFDFFVDRQFPDFFGFDPGQEAFWNLGGLAFMITALSFVIFRQFANVKMLVIGGRKKVNQLYTWLLLSLPCLLLHSSFDFAAAQLLVVPLGVLISRSFVRGRGATGEAAHLLMLVLALGLCIYPILVG